MKQNELKRILKPLIKQCIKEVIFEDGVLSGIISEVIKGTNDNNLIQEKKSYQQEERVVLQENQDLKKKNNLNLQTARKKMLDAIGKDSFNGVDLFENTRPISKPGAPGGSVVSSPLDQYDPDDSGIDISDMFNPKWKEMI